MRKFTFMGRELTAKRITIKGKGYYNTIRDKDKVVARTKWSSNRTRTEGAMQERLKEKFACYRSMMTLNIYNGTIEYRVWAYAKRPDITHGDLQGKIDELIALFPPANENVFSVSEEYYEENRQVDEDEAEDMGMWRGTAIYNVRGRQYVYNARGDPLVRI